MSDFAKNLRYYRKQKRLSQAELAKALNYGDTTISNYESGRAPVRGCNNLTLSK